MKSIASFLFVGVLSMMSAPNCSGQLPKWERRGLDSVYVTNVNISPYVWLAATQAGVRVSTDEGRTWMQPQKPPFIAAGNISSTAILTDGKLYAVSQGSLYRSIDTGKTWDFFNFASLPKSTVGFFRIDTGSNTVFLFFKFLYRSTNNGITWDSLVIDTNTTVSNLRMLGQEQIIAETNHGLYYSSNNGTTWSRSSSISIQDPLSIGYGKELYFIKNTFIHGKGSFDSLYVSHDFGATWQNVGSVQPSDQHNSILTLPDGSINLFSSNNAIIRSTDQGASWVIWDTGLVGTDTISHNPLGVESGALTSNGDLLIWTFAGIYIVPRYDTIFKVKSRVLHGGGHQGPLFPTSALYPDPAIDQINFDLSGTGHVHVRILNVFGMPVLDEIPQSLSDASYSVNIKKLIPSTYYIEIALDDKMVYKPFIKD